MEKTVGALEKVLLSSKQKHTWGPREAFTCLKKKTVEARGGPTFFKKRQLGTMSRFYFLLKKTASASEKILQS